MANQILRYFAYAHLPSHLQEVSKPFAELAEAMDKRLVDSAEKTTCFRKLLEAKDCAVRACLDGADEAHREMLKHVASQG